MYKAILSDLGGVIIFFDHGIATRAFAEVCDSTPEEIRDYSFRSEHQFKMEKGFISGDEFYRILQDRFRFRIDRRKFNLLYSDIFVLNPPMDNLLRSLKKYYTLCMVSNIGPIHHEFCEKKFDIMGIFNYKILSYQVKAMKPEPEIYRAAVAKLGIKPEECIYVDDLEKFVEAGAKQGFRAIKYTSHPEFLAELSKILPAEHLRGHNT